MTYGIQTLTLTDAYGNIDRFANGAANTLLAGTVTDNTDTPPEWKTLAQLGIATTDDLEGYLPLTGGTCTGLVTFNNGIKLATTSGSTVTAMTGILKADSTGVVSPITASSTDENKLLQYLGSGTYGWKALSDITGDYLPLAGGVMGLINGTAGKGPVSLDIADSKGRYSGVYKGEFTSNKLVLRTKIAPTRIVGTADNYLQLQIQIAQETSGGKFSTIYIGLYLGTNGIDTTKSTYSVVGTLPISSIGYYTQTSIHHNAQTYGYAFVITFPSSANYRFNVDVVSDNLATRDDGHFQDYIKGSDDPESPYYFYPCGVLYGWGMLDSYSGSLTGTLDSVAIPITSGGTGANTLAGAQSNLGIPSAYGSTPAVDTETGFAGTAGAYAPGDHAHPLPYAVPAAYRFFYPRKIGIGGVITAEAEVYDGSDDLILQATQIDPSGIINTVPIEKGGTGISSYTAGDMLYAKTDTDGSVILDKLAKGTNGYILKSDGTNPVWSSLANAQIANINHNHDNTYLKLIGGSGSQMTGAINFNSNVTTPIVAPGLSQGVAIFDSNGNLSTTQDVNSYIVGNTEYKNYFEADFYGQSPYYSGIVTLAHTNKRNTVYNIAVGDNAGYGGEDSFTRYIQLPEPKSNNLGDELTIIFTNKNQAYIGYLNCNCVVSGRLLRADYVDASSLTWSSGNVVKFVCITKETPSGSSVTYYWRAIKLSEQSWSN